MRKKLFFLYHFFFVLISVLIFHSKKTYNTISFDHKIVFLVKCMRNPAIALASKTLALVMLRRLISTSVEENWSSLNDSIKTSLKVELLNAVQQEPDQSIRKKITDVIAELARFLIGMWHSRVKFIQF